MKLQKTTRRWFRVGLAAVGLAALMTFLPTEFGSQAGSAVTPPKTGNPFHITRSDEAGLENYDLRLDETAAAKQTMESYRQTGNFSTDRASQTVKGFAEGETTLRGSVPTLEVVYNDDLKIPEIIAPNAMLDGSTSLTGPSTAKRTDILRNFLRQNNSLIGVSDAQINQLKVSIDAANPDGVLSYVHMDQLINGVPVFRAEIKGAFNKSGEMFRVVNNLAPGLNYDSVSTNFGNPVDAVKAAFHHVSRPMVPGDIEVNKSLSDGNRTVFGGGDWATLADRMYFPTEAGIAVPAYRVVIWEPVTSYNVIVDAQTGTMLWRKNMGNDQTQTATYQVYTSPSNVLQSADSPAPLSPYVSANTSPADGAQGALLVRNNVTLIGNEGDLSFNNLGWMTDGANAGNGHTDGNNTVAGIDIVAPNGVDAPVPGVSRVFSSAWNPPPGNPAPGDDHTLAAARNGAVIQMFYVMNRYHDALYKLGFTEPFRNFQNDNFGRNPGGLNANAIAGVDRISSEGQDSSGTNNANFNTQADGIAGRMQMFRFTGTTPNRDGTTDVDIIVHEVTHGTSNRLHNNAAGLTTNMAGGMGEGWGDFYGHTMLAEPGDSVDGAYATGGYVLPAGFGVIGQQNYYYGIRRFPKARMAYTGGPMNRPHNPMTFADIDSTQINTTDGAFAAMSGPHISTTADQVHAAGEVWSTTLWEVRCLLVARLGYAVGTQKALQFVTDGMKLDGTNPTFLVGRNSIIQAAINSGTAADVADVREGFRIRGMGFSASIQVAGTGGSTRVTQAFDRAHATFVDPFSVSDAPGDNDGFPEPGENVLLSVAVTNTSGNNILSVMANVVGGGSADYGDIANGATVVRTIAYTVPGGAACGSFHAVTVNGTGTIQGDPMPSAIVPFVRSFRLGAPIGGAPVSFTNATAINIPAGQPGSTSGPAGPYPSNIMVSGLTGQKVLRVTFNNFHHEFEDDIDMLLVGPAGQKMVIMSDNGGTTEQLTPITFSLVDSAAAILPDATGFVNGNEYRPSNVTAGDAFVAPAPAAPHLNPAPAGATTFTTAFGTDGAALNGTWSLYIVDDAGADPGVIDGGWTLTFEANDFACVLAPTVSKARADFDGDFKSDVSVVRDGGTWYLNRSTAGFGAVNFGAAGDKLVPGDFDGDGKADVAVFRPSTATFHILRSSDNVVVNQPWGANGDIPVVGDYDGDGKSDIAVYRPSTTGWSVLKSGGGSSGINWGASGDIPLVGDFDGDGKADFTVFRPAAPNVTCHWHTFTSQGVYKLGGWGISTDKLVPGDYNGDGTTDYSVFRAGIWYILNSGTAIQQTINFGAAGDVPVPADYDGDGKEDVAVFRNGSWFLLGSTAGPSSQIFGLAGDAAVPAAYIP